MTEAVLVLFTILSIQQHEGHSSAATEPAAARMSSSMTAQMPPHGMGTEGIPNLDIPMSRFGSGTSWLPDSSPMFGFHITSGSWAIMAHGNAFAGWNVQGSSRGAKQLTALTWWMLMARRELAGGAVEPRLMLSLDPLFTGKRGYPLLLQSGESAGGEALHDRQHPHDLFMEMGLAYRRQIMGGVGGEIYVALPGEPALGPTAFPHRPSAFPDPMAPISHHWQDSTHIAFGVLTAGVFTKTIKLEGSWFNGREPDEFRYNLELRRPDSYSGRVSVNPARDFAFQISYGFLKSPEVLTPDESLHRVTASGFYNKKTNHGNLALSTVWGRNIIVGGGPSDAFLVETAWNIDGTSEPFARVEYTEKLGHDLVLAPGDEETVFSVAEIALGYLYHLPSWHGLQPGIGARGAVYQLEDDLSPYYGTRNPIGGMVFLNLRPGPMGM